MASNVIEGPIDPRKSHYDMEPDFFAKDWGNPEIDFATSEDGFGKDMAAKCTKKPCLVDSCQADRFSNHVLPLEYQDRDDIVNYVKEWIPLTVKMIIHEFSKTRIRRPGQYPPSHATGVIDTMKWAHEKESCICHKCQKTDEKVSGYWSFIIYTASHTILDDIEAASTEFECFFDSDDDKKDGKKVKMLYGIEISKPICNSYTSRTDRCQILCVTHEQELADKLIMTKVSLRNPFYGTDLGVIISHPHNLGKRVTVGKIKYLHVPIGDLTDGGRLEKGTKITFGPRAQYRLPNDWKPDSNSNQQEISHVDGFELKPGTNRLLHDMCYVLPQETRYAFKYLFSDIPWFTFTPNTTFFLPNGQEFYFPEETVFTMDMVSQPYVYMSYDIPTCSGTSGALILMDWGQPPVEGFRHYGSLSSDKEKEETNLNASGRQLYAQ